ncbi:MAG: dihydroxy-acid dehydratase, partial [Paracoccaceae bacterium]
DGELRGIAWPSVLVWEDGARETLNDRVLRPAGDPFQATGGLSVLRGSLGTGVMKVSAVKPERHVVEAPARVFDGQEAVRAAFRAGELDRDVVVVVRYQGPKANGMPELHSLSPQLAVLQDRGFKVALVTDGRMSGASGKVPSAIHVCPEALDGGPLAHLRDGDLVRVDAVEGRLDVLTEGLMERPVTHPDLSMRRSGTGRELFDVFRSHVGPAAEGACVA